MRNIRRICVNCKYGNLKKAAEFKMSGFFCCNKETQVGSVFSVNHECDKREFEPVDQSQLESRVVWLKKKGKISNEKDYI